MDSIHNDAWETCNQRYQENSVRAWPQQQAHWGGGSASEARCVGHYNDLPWVRSQEETD